MASKKKDVVGSVEKGYTPKATARHAKITKSKKEEIDIFKKRIDTDKYLAKKYESSRKTEIKALQKEERAAAKAELKESIVARKESERRDKEKLRKMQQEERECARKQGKEHFDEEAWLKGGRKNRSASSEKKAVPETAEEPFDDIAVSEDEIENKVS